MSLFDSSFFFCLFSLGRVGLGCRVGGAECLLLSPKGQLKQALTEGLANSQPLCLSKVDAVKALSSKAVIGALKAAAVKDIKGLVVGLSADEADVAMKHVFKGMESQEGCERLLEWHGQLFDKFGIGCIVRAINERSPCPEAVIQ